MLQVTLLCLLCLLLGLQWLRLQLPWQLGARLEAVTLQSVLLRRLGLPQQLVVHEPLQAVGSAVELLQLLQLLQLLLLWAREVAAAAAAVLCLLVQPWVPHAKNSLLLLGPWVTLFS